MLAVRDKTPMGTASRAIVTTLDIMPKSRHCPCVYPLFVRISRKRSTRKYATCYYFMYVFNCTR